MQSWSFADLLNQHARQGAAVWKAVQEGMLLKFPNEPPLSIEVIGSNDLRIQGQAQLGLEDVVLTPLGELWSKINAKKSQKQSEIAAQDARETERITGSRIKECEGA